MMVRQVEDMKGISQCLPVTHLLFFRSEKTLYTAFRGFQGMAVAAATTILTATSISMATVVASLVMGAIIGLIELFFVHADERGMGWLAHGFHALPVAMLLTFIAMHIQIIYPYVGLGTNPSPWIDGGLRVVIGLIAAFKVKGSAAIIKGHNSIGEKLPHALLIGALIAGSPYIYVFIQPFLPAWAGGISAAKAATP